MSLPTERKLFAKEGRVLHLHSDRTVIGQNTQRKAIHIDSSAIDLTLVEEVVIHIGKVKTRYVKEES